MIQAQAEQVLRQTVAQWGAKDATAIVARPVDRRGARDGPDARLQRQRHLERRPLRRLLRNRAVTDTYEPGSTFKLVTITGALSEGLVKPTTRFTLPYRLQYGPCAQCSVHDAEFRAHGELLGRPDPLATPRTSARSRSPAARRRRASQALGDEVRVRLADGDRLPRREPRLRAAARPVERADDRQRADRAGHLGDADPDGLRLRRGRQRRRLDPAAPRRAGSAAARRSAGGTAG